MDESGGICYELFGFGSSAIMRVKIIPFSDMEIVFGNIQGVQNLTLSLFLSFSRTLKMVF